MTAKTPQPLKYGGVAAAALLAGAVIAGGPSLASATNGQRLAALEAAKIAQATQIVQLQARVLALEVGAPLPSPTGTLGPTTSTSPTTTVAPTSPPVPTPASTASPAFAEECNGPLGSKWSAVYQVGDPGFGLDSDFGGNLSQVSVANGLCTITAQRKSTPSGRAYASAAMGTRTTFAQAYGTFEARIRYPAGQGAFPAFWTLAAGSLQTPPEVDIFEAYPAPPGAGGGSGTNVLIQTLHSAGNPPRYFVVDRGINWTTGFHVFSLTWSPGLMVFKVDGVESGRLTTSIPSVAMYPIVNLALGAPGYRVNSSTPNTLTMDVDWIRVWR